MALFFFLIWLFQIQLMLDHFNLFPLIWTSIWKVNAGLYVIFLYNLIKSGRRRRRRVRQLGKGSFATQSFGEITSKKLSSARTESFVWTGWRQRLRVNKLCWKLLLPPVSQLFTVMSDCIGTSCTNRTTSSALLPNASASADTAATQVCSRYCGVRDAMDRYLPWEQLLISV